MINVTFLLKGSTRSTLSRKHQNLGVVYPGITAYNTDSSIQALSFCAKNPSQKLPPEEAKAIRKQRAQQGKSKLLLQPLSVFPSISTSVHLNLAFHHLPN